jgi:long-chain acyl-CoA synthetase
MFGSAIEAGRSEQIKILNPLPLYHIFSFTVCGLLGMYGGWEDILVTNPRDIDGLVKTIEQHRPHVIPSVNTLFIGMLHHPKFASLDFSRLALSIGGGTAIIKAVSDQWQQVTGMIINEGYGMSETSPVISFNPPGISSFNGSVGLPLAMMDIKIIDEDGGSCVIGIRGEVAIKGPQVMRGYWQRDNTDTFTEDGYFKSGDIGVMNAEGFLTLVDRKKDMILVSGFNVYPNEVEAALTEHSKVLEVAVIGIADAHSGEVPKAFVVKKDSSLTVEELQDFASERLTGYKRPQSYEFIDELPKTAVGKILRKSLR